MAARDRRILTQCNCLPGLLVQREIPGPLARRVTQVLQALPGPSAKPDRLVPRAALGPLAPPVPRAIPAPSAQKAMLVPRARPDPREIQGQWDPRVMPARSGQPARRAIRVFLGHEAIPAPPVQREIPDRLALLVQWARSFLRPRLSSRTVVAMGTGQ